uniref:Small basic protein VP2 n=1 Tax=Sapovirus swine/WG214C/2009/USA TaxID=1304601 RepID=M4QBF0_9CALI|nr:small basic protein VP2 [Sapovirus swine/WG214C/2009/USA]
MSWFAGALGTAGLLGDIANTIGNIVAQQQVVANQRRQLELYQQAIDKNLKLQDKMLEMNYELATFGPSLQYSSARKLGFNHIEATQMLGSHRVTYGGVDVEPRALTSLPYYMQNPQLQGQAHSVVSQFVQGAPGFTKPAPAGFSNPNYGVKLTAYRQNIQHQPGDSNA